MPAIVEFYYDLASPNVYMANKVLQDARRRAGIKIIYRPVLLGGVFKATNNHAPMVTFAAVMKNLPRDGEPVSRAARWTSEKLYIGS